MNLVLVDLFPISHFMVEEREEQRDPRCEKADKNGSSLVEDIS